MIRLTALILFLAPVLGAQEFATLPLDSLHWTGETVPGLNRRLSRWDIQHFVLCTPLVEGAEEAWLAIPAEILRPDGVRHRLGELELSVRGAGKQGVLWLPGPWPRMERYTFEFDPAQADRSEGAFLTSRYLAYAWRQAMGLPGGAWFRHQKEATAKALGALGIDLPEMDEHPRFEGGRPNGFEETFELFSGGRALSENLALDDAIGPVGGEVGSVALASIAGIEVPEINWEPLLEGKHPNLDPLSAFLPVDQHAVFFQSFDSLVRLCDEARRDGAPLLQVLEGSSEDVHSEERYERQLALPLDEVTRLFGTGLVERVALTGGDPYFRTGTDVALLFSSPHPDELAAAIRSRQAAAALAHADAETVGGRIGGVDYEGVRTPSRALCSFMARLGDVLLVTNSKVQLERITAVSAGREPALAEAPEYRWFRDRYPLGDSEDALIVVTDATIRRLASPRWRIGASRRTRAAAHMAEELAARLAAAIERGDSAEALAEIDAPRGGYGTFEFLTPISELDLETVTDQERSGYEDFRARYERRWREVFDPLAIRLRLQDSRLEADLSIRPLAVRSDYRDLIELTQGAHLDPAAGDLHEGALAHFAFALSTESTLYRQVGNFLRNGILRRMADPLAWTGSEVTLWLEQDPEFWEQAAKEEKPLAYLEENLYRLPIALRIPSTSELRLAAFLTAVRSFIEGSAPGLVSFETREYEGQGYVAILPEDLSQELGQPLALYYVTLPDAWVISLREDLIRAAIDRAAAPAQPSEEQEWLGQSAGITLERGFQDIVSVLWGEELRPSRYELAWRALPILDEWHRLVPEVDPVRFHHDHFGLDLREPGGGRYRYDPEEGCMISTTYGAPGAPLEGPVLPLEVLALERARLGVTFEEGDGLRARVVLER